MLSDILSLIIVIQRLDHINLESLKLLNFYNYKENSSIGHAMECCNPSLFIKKIIYRNSKIINLLNKELEDYSLEKIRYAQKIHEILKKYDLIFNNFTLVSKNVDNFFYITNYYYELNDKEYMVEFTAEQTLLKHIIMLGNYKEVDMIFWYILRNYFELTPKSIRQIKIEDVENLVVKRAK